MRRRISTVLAAAVLCLAAGNAAAQDAAPSAEDVKAAAEAFDKGREAFRKREYTEAAEHFETADDRAPSAAVIELAIRAREKAGQIDRAATLAAVAVRRHPSEAKIAKLAEGLLARAKKQFFTLVARCDTPCALVVDGKIIHGAASVEHTVFLADGEHPVVASWSEGRTEKQSATAVAGGTGELAFKEPPLPEKEPPPAAVVTAPPAPPPAAPPPPPPESKGLSPLFFWIGAGTTAVLAGVSVWSGIDTQNNPGPDRVRAACDSGDVERCNTLFDEGTASETRTNIFIGVTAGVAVITGVLGAFATDWGTAETPPGAARRAPSRTWEPIMGWGQGATVGARGRF